MWINKIVYADLMFSMDEMGFEYIENISWIKLDEAKIKGHEHDPNLNKMFCSSSEGVFSSA